MNPALRRSAAHAFVEAIEFPELDQQDRHHLQRVLRLRAGEVVTVSDGRGAWRVCRFGADGGLSVDGDVVVEPSRQPPLTVGFALPKGDRPEWIVQKLTEIGIDRMVIVEADRSVTVWDGERATRNLAKLGRVAREAAMQSRRVWLPEITGPVDIRRVITDQHPGTVRLAEPGADPLTPHDSFVLIGPEGGWSPAELEVCDGHVGLGASILRIETAALVAATRMVMLRTG